MKKHIIYLFAIILICSFSTIKQDLYAQSTEGFTLSQKIYNSDLIDLGNGWFEVTESVEIKNITPEEATEKAINKACNSAIVYFSGIESTERIIDLQSGNLTKNAMDYFSSISRQTSQGIILEKKIMKDDIVALENQLYKVITVKVKVGKQKGEKDPSFELTAELNREYFNAGEELEISVKSSKDCYLTILNICSNDSVYVIFPNEYREDNFVRSGKLFSLPNSKDKEIGLTFQVALLPNKNEDTEMIKVIATKQKIDFSSLYSFSAYGTYQTAVTDLQNWIIKIPRNEIEEIDLQYLIRSK